MCDAVTYATRVPSGEMTTGDSGQVGILTIDNRSSGCSWAAALAAVGASPKSTAALAAARTKTRVVPRNTLNVWRSWLEGRPPGSKGDLPGACRFGRILR